MHRCVCVLVGTLLGLQPLSAAAFNYADFSSIAGLTLNGSAAQSGVRLRLTSSTSQAGSAYYSTLVDVAGGFDTLFQYQITSPVADGFSFIIQNSGAGTGALGGAGGGIGYFGIANSVVVEFDTFNNGGSIDPDDRHVAIQSCGVGANTTDSSVCNFGVAPGIGQLKDGAIHTVEIIYSGGVLRVYMDAGLILTSSGDPLAGLSLNAGRAYVGFTGATGGASELADILSWNFTSTIPEPATALLVAAGLALVTLRRRLVR